MGNGHIVPEHDSYDLPEHFDDPASNADSGVAAGVLRRAGLGGGGGDEDS